MIHNINFFKNIIFTTVVFLFSKSITGLEDTFENYLTTDCFQNLTSCKEAYAAADYPYDKIVNLVSTKQAEGIFEATVVSTKINVLSRSGFDNFVDVPGACKEIKQRIYPLKGKGVDGKSYFIVNIEGWWQDAILIKCNKRDAPCGDTSTEPENSTYRCKQLYKEVSYPSIRAGQNITLENTNKTTFKVPSGCLCERIRTYH